MKNILKSNLNNHVTGYEESCRVVEYTIQFQANQKKQCHHVIKLSKETLKRQ